jgi:hypothetical protein
MSDGMNEWTTEQRNNSHTKAYLSSQVSICILCLSESYTACRMSDLCDVR